jgi:SAM-dependent methyltransferase
VRLGEGKRFIEKDWKRRAAYTLLGEPHVPGWIRLQHVLRSIRLLPLDGKPVRFLDAGCSRGDLLTYLAERHRQWSFVGLELEGDRVEMAETIRRRANLRNISYLRADICHLPFQNEFDVVVCSDVLEHIPDDRAAFLNLSQALKPGGYLLVTSPSVPQPRHLPFVAWRERRVGFDPSEYGHVRDGYSLDRLRNLFEEAGTEPIQVRFTYGRCGTLCFDLFFSIGDNRPNPLVFVVLFPLLKALAFLDLYGEPNRGAAVLGMARKPLDTRGAH